MRAWLTLVLAGAAALVMAPAQATWAFHPNAPAHAGRTGGGVHVTHGAPPGHAFGRHDPNRGARIHDRIGSGFAGARVRSARETHQQQLNNAFHRSGLHVDLGFHGHHGHHGDHGHHGHHNGWYAGCDSGHFGHHNHPSIVIVSPPVVFANPYFCDVCGVGFAGDALFYSHLQHFHAVPAYALGTSCVWVGDQLVFSGF
jgi:hypothetical protein